jgi:hypothetical protein
VKRTHLHLRSVCSLAVVSLFVLFLASSAPHRVHHIFENLSHSDENIDSQELYDQQTVTTHTHHDADHSHGGTTNRNNNEKKSAKTDCIAQSVAKNAYLSIAEVSASAFTTAEFDSQSNPTVLPFVSFNPSPRTERAPPRI